MKKETKYYVYISDEKVEMYFRQLPKTFLDNISGEVKIDLKIVSASVGKKATGDNKFSNTAIVSRYILENEDVGTVDNPRKFFAGTMRMRWGELGNNLVFFAGSTKETVVGLGGSTFHLIGSKQDLATPQDGIWSMSSAQAIINQLSNIMKKERTTVSDFNLSQIVTATKQLNGPQQNLEFIAKTLIRHHDSRRGINLLLGSPIYVALI